MKRYPTDVNSTNRTTNGEIHPPPQGSQLMDTYFHRYIK